MRAWTALISGLLVVVIGASVLRSRIRWGRARTAGGAAGSAPNPDAAMHSHDDEPEHVHAHAHGHVHTHAHGHHHIPDEITWRGVFAMGASAGLIPCPSALVVLLAAVSQNELTLGLLLIVAFSVGLAGTLTDLLVREGDAARRRPVRLLRHGQPPTIAQPTGRAARS